MVLHKFKIKLAPGASSIEMDGIPIFASSITIHGEAGGVGRVTIEIPSLDIEIDGEIEETHLVIQAV